MSMGFKRKFESNSAALVDTEIGSSIMTVIIKQYAVRLNINFVVKSI